MFKVVCEKSHFLRLTIKNVSLTLPHFAYRTNWDLELGTETISGLQTCFNATNPIAVSDLED